MHHGLISLGNLGEAISLGRKNRRQIGSLRTCPRHRTSTIIDDVIFFRCFLLGSLGSSFALSFFTDLFSFLHLSDSVSCFLDFFPDLFFRYPAQLFRGKGWTTKQALLLFVDYEDALHQGIHIPALRVKGLFIQERICARLLYKRQSVVANDPAVLEEHIVVLDILLANNVGLIIRRLIAFLPAKVLDKVLKVVSRLRLIDLDSGSECMA